MGVKRRIRKLTEAQKKKIEIFPPPAIVIDGLPYRYSLSGPTLTYWDFQHLSIEKLEKKYIEGAEFELEKSKEEIIEKIIEEQIFTEDNKKTEDNKGTDTGVIRYSFKCPVCGYKLTEYDLTKGYCQKCYFFISDDFKKQLEEERKNKKEYQEKAKREEKRKKILEEWEKIKNKALKKLAKEEIPHITKIKEKIKKGELLEIPTFTLGLDLEPKIKGSYVYLHKDALYEFDNDDEYTAKEKLLLILELEDEERQKFERLKRKFVLAQEIEKTPKRERIPEEVRIAVWRRDGGKCAKCGSRKNLEYDHIIPLSKGGSNTVRNIELLCEECNRKKRDKIE